MNFKAMPIDEIYDRVRGAFYGFAIGDALGATTEFLTKQQIRAKYGCLDDIIGGGAFRWKPGECTDDTALMLAVADACTLHHAPDVRLKVTCHMMRDWFLSMPKDIGETCKSMISSCMWLPYQDWFTAAAQLHAERPTLGNGSLMRCLYPILEYEMYRDKADLEFAVLQGRLTHNNAICDIAIKDFGRLVRGDIAYVRKRYAEYATPNHTGEVRDTIAWVAHYLYQYQCDVYNCIVKAVNDGGDADTIGALTGAVAGLRRGFGQIPEKWVKALDGGVVRRIEELSAYLVNRFEGDRKII